MKARHVALGAKFGGRCLVCDRQTGSRPHELAVISLYRTETGRYGVVHPACADGSTKNKIGGGIVYRREPDDVIDIPEVVEW